MVHAIGSRVLKQYRKNLIGTQLVIAMMTVAMLVQSHRLITGIACFVVMQLGAIVGAAWGASLRSRIERGRTGIRTQ
jgi:hypothetical protein